MSANTSPDSIVYPVSTDQIAPLETVFANMATSVQNALNTRAVKGYRWADSTARAAQTGMTLGDLGFQADDATLYRYSGSAWAIWERDSTTFTPSWTNLTVSGTNTGIYNISGGRANVVIFTEGAITGNASVALPVTALTTALANNLSVLGPCTLIDASAGASGRFSGVTVFASSTSVYPRFPNPATGAIQNLSSTIPFTWVSGDSVRMQFSYLVA